MVALGGGGIAGLIVACAFAVIFLVARALQRMEMRDAARDNVIDLDPSLLYPDLTVKKARELLAEWEEMSDAARAAVPAERQALLRQIEKDLAGRPDEGAGLRPEDNIVVDVEPDGAGGTIVGIEETADIVAIPPRCVGCLGDPILRVPTVGVAWLKFPYCDACRARPRAVKLALSEGGTIRLAFRHAAYAEEFAALNRGA